MKKNIEKNNWREKKLSDKKLIESALKERYFINKELYKSFKDDVFTKRIGQMVILENIISYKLADLIILSQNIINKKSNIRNFNYGVHRLLEKCTLGSLINKLNNISFSSKNLLKNLISFNELRINITHKMHLGYSDLKEIEKEILNIIKIGKSLLKSLDREIKKRTPEFVVNMPRVIKADELIEAFEKAEDNKEILDLFKKYG